jgi:hypothetical protein
VIYTTVSREMRGSQVDRWKIRFLRRGVVTREKKGLKMIGTTMIMEKRGIQWDRL